MARLLLVDDSNLTLKKMKKMVAEVGHHDVTTASHGNEAVEILEEKKFDLIITDLHMPHMDGFQLIQVVREKQISTPIIVCTADQQESTVEYVAKLGAQELVNKPFLYNKENMSATIEKYTKAA